MNKKFLKEAEELSKRWDEFPDEFSRAITAFDLESHRLLNECFCQVCKAPASYSRRNPSFEYYCSEHAPDDATCFVKEEYRSKYK